MNFFGRIFGGNNNLDRKFAIERPNKVVNFWVLDSKGEYTGKQGSIIKIMYLAIILAYQKFGKKIILILPEENQKKE